jgi:hypothetical protein
MRASIYETLPLQQSTRARPLRRCHNIWFEDQLDGFGIDRVNGQRFLEFGVGLVAQNVFCVLFGLIFIELDNDLAHHRSHQIIVVVERSGNRDQLAPPILLVSEDNKETAIPVHGDDIECVVAVAGPLDHLLEYAPLVVSPGYGLDEFRRRLVAFGFAPRQNLRP